MYSIRSHNVKLVESSISKYELFKYLRFCLKMVHSTAISGQIFLILMLDQFSQRRKMRLEQANLMLSRAKPSELFLEVTAVLRSTVCKICN